MDKMLYNADHISKLTLDEVAGTINPEDREYLYRAIAESEAAKTVWEQIHQQFAGPHVQQAMKTFPDTFTAQQAMAAAKKRNSKLFSIKAAASVAASIVVFLGVYMLFKSNASRNNNEMASTPDKKRIELHLAGKTIDLSHQQGTVQVAGVSFNNSNKSLTYSSNTNTGQEWASLQVPAGKDYKIQLADGTEIWLNAATSLQFPMAFTGNTREVTINGEAYLKVAKDPGKPFVVHLPHSTVQVLGTEFNVNTYDSGQLKVALVEGSVKMKAGKDSALLQPGFEIDYTVQKGMEIERFDANDVLAWRQGIYLFNAVSAQDLCKIMNRHYGITVVMDNTMGGHKPFTGSIDRNKPIASFLEVLKFSKYINDYHYGTDNVLHLK